MIGPVTYSEIADAISLDSDQIYWDELLSPEDLAESVRQNGIAVFPGLLSAEMLQQLNSEFDQLIASHVAGVGPFVVDSYDRLVNVRVTRDKLPPSNYTAIQSLFSQSYMADVSQTFFGQDGFRLNGEIFVTELGEGPEKLDAPPFALHFDKRQVLKFFFYLTDTDHTNGAMRASPGSSRIIRDVRLEASSSGDLNNIPNVLPDIDVPSLPITGPAGTMFVFDTDMAHGASRVNPGKTRKSLRGHTHSHEMLQAMGLSPPYN